MLGVNELDYFDHEMMALLYGDPPEYVSDKAEKEVNMSEYVRCNKCGVVYTDKGSIDMVKKWLAEPDKYAPCPMLSCDGQMEIVQKGGEW